MRGFLMVHPRDARPDRKRRHDSPLVHESCAARHDEKATPYVGHVLKAGPPWACSTVGGKSCNFFGWTISQAISTRPRVAHRATLGAVTGRVRVLRNLGIQQRDVLHATGLAEGAVAAHAARRAAAQIGQQEGVMPLPP